ncbi:MAG: hypothetical protein H0T60_05425 [Acidobacteria bacterium]|nr:hypothetical protein [Acidobacteriota bacterium]
MKTCPACNRTYADEQKFCPGDGTPLASGASPATGQQPSQFAPPDPWTAPESNPPPPAGAAPPPSWQTPEPARKRKIWPWVLGIVAVLGLGLVALLGIGGYALYKYGDKNVSTNTNSNTVAVTDADSADDVDIAGTEKYVNSRADKSGNLATHYVDFSFRYPDTWKVDPSPEPSFVRVERANDDGGTIENFSVGWFSATGPVKGNKQLLSQVVNNLSGQISGNFPGYEKISEGFTKFGGYDGYELRFGRTAGGGAKALPYWGRVVVLPDPNGGKDGVSIIMLATGHSDEVERASDLGLKGELPTIIKTFRLGASK